MPASAKSTAALVTTPRGVSLTPDGRRLLEERIGRLHVEVLDRIRPHLMGPDRDERDVAQFERTLAEVARLEGIVAASASLTCSRRPTRVEPGALVEIASTGGAPEVMTVRIVHPEEAALDDERISWSSPLAVALLGARVGETREVSSPRGQWTCTVRSIKS